MHEADLECPRTSSTGSTVDNASEKKRRVQKSMPDDAVPLPSPFPLPKHYSADVEVALTAKQFSTSARRQFVSSIAVAMCVTSGILPPKTIMLV